MTALLLAASLPGCGDGWRSGLACNGTTDDRNALQRRVEQAGSRQAIEIPDGCQLRLSAPPAGEAAITLPAGATLRCRGPGATLRLDARVCSSGRYAGAACATDADCSFCGPACSGSTCAGTAFAALPDVAYTVVSGRGPGAALEGCTIDVRQADAFNRCVGGRNDGKPCKQVCSAADGVTPLVNGGGIACETDAACVHLSGAGARCLNREDCSAAGGTCTGAPGSPAGSGKVNVVDFSTARASVRSLRVIDHRAGDFTVSTGPGSEIAALDNTLTDRPPIANVTAGTSAVAIGAVVRAGSVVDSTLHGTAAGVSARKGAEHPGSRIERNTIPGSPSPEVGILVDESGGRIADNTIRNCTGRCIAVVGSGSASVTGNELSLAPGGTGIEVQGVFNLIDGNLIAPSGPDIASTTGILVGGTQDRVVNNHVHLLETGIRTTLDGFNVQVANNRLSSNRPDSAAALKLYGAGIQLVGNYVNWTTTNARRCGTTCAHRGATCSTDAECGPCSNAEYGCLTEPLVWLGSSDPVAGTVTHPAVIGNLFAGQLGVTAVRVAHMGGRCLTGADVGRRCTTAEPCAGDGMCSLPSGMDDAIIAANSFFNPGLLLDLGEINDGDTSLRNWLVTSNLHANVGNPAASSIKFPSHAAAAANFQVRANAFDTAEPFLGWRWEMGVLEGNGPLAASDDAVEIVYLTNRTGAQGRPFSAVEIATADDNSFVYAAPGSSRAVGVLLDEPGDAMVGKIATRGTTSCSVTAEAVQRGDLLEVSDTAGRLTAAAGRGQPILAVALSGKRAGAPGTVRCLVQPGRIS